MILLFTNHFIYLLPGIRREVEHEHGEEGDAHAGDDQVDCVEQGLPPHRDVEGDVQVRLLAARVELDVPDRRHLEDVPLDRHVELGEVDPDVNDGGRANLLGLGVDLDHIPVLVLVPQVDLKSNKDDRDFI